MSIHRFGAELPLVTLTLWLQSAGTAALIAWVRRALAGDMQQIGALRSAALIVRLTAAVVVLHGMEILLWACFYRWPLPEAVQRLSRKFKLSERQAYRYLREASRLVRPVEVTEATVPVTLKLPPRTVELLRKHAKSSGLTIGAIVTGALNAFLGALKKHG